MNQKQGFTLVELMIVMVIMGILATIGVTAFISSQVKGRDTTRKGNLKAISQAIEMYYNDKGVYPTGSNGVIPLCYTVAGAGPGACGKDFPVFKDSITNGATYMTKFPIDPVSTQKYYYVSSSGTQFQIYAHLENAQDSTIITPAVPTTDCGGACNWGLSSANTNP